MTFETVSSFETLFSAHRPFLWGLCYRLTGNAADADDLVQETFVRAMTHPPARTDEPWRPWLVRVALNLGKDLLRRRRRRAYIGPWLPSPIKTGDETEPPSHEPLLEGDMSTEGRYELLESVSIAFLLALEALTPQQRAVLLLRDVFDYSVQETAAALGISDANVKTTHHRARWVMQTYDRTRMIPTRTLQERTRQVMEQFLTCLFTRDVNKLESLLAADVRLVSDGGGEFLAARRPIVGRDKILRFYMKAVEHNRLGSVAVQMLNGLPAIVMEFTNANPRSAPCVIQQFIINRDEEITAMYAVLASRKLTAVRRPSLR